MSIEQEIIDKGLTAPENAVQKIWVLEGYLLKQKLSEGEL